MHSTGAPPPLIVRSDLRALRSRATTMIVLHSVVLACAVGLIVVTSSLGSGAASFTTFAMVLLVISSVMGLAVQTYQLGARTAVAEPMRLTSWGLEAHGAQGTVRLPWAAVTRIERVSRLGQQYLRVRPQPQAAPGQYGVDADPARWRSIARRGVVLEQVGIDVPLDHVLRAAAALSDGRVPVG